MKCVPPDSSFPDVSLEFHSKLQKVTEKGKRDGELGREKPGNFDSVFGHGTRLLTSQFVIQKNPHLFFI